MKTRVCLKYFVNDYSSILFCNTWISKKMGISYSFIGNFDRTFNLTLVKFFARLLERSVGCVCSLVWLGHLSHNISCVAVAVKRSSNLLQQFPDLWR